jgi:hypothetical protein
LDDASRRQLSADESPNDRLGMGGTLGSPLGIVDALDGKAVDGELCSGVYLASGCLHEPANFMIEMCHE